MKACDIETTLESLYSYLDSLPGKAPLDELTSRVERLEVTYDDFAPFVRFSDQCYTRNLVRAGQHYNVLVLCWKNGQRSPIHDHKGSSCVLRVLRGTMTETLFEFTHHGLVKACSSHDSEPGSVAGQEDDDLHQVSNLQDGDAELVTLHIYSPPLKVMGTYSLTDRKRGQEMMMIEFSDAAGI
jgi:cysteine dioxygenase